MFFIMVLGVKFIKLFSPKKYPDVMVENANIIVMRDKIIVPNEPK